MPPKPKPQLTHFLLLPLVTPTSRPQLQSSLQRLAADVTTPNEAGESKLPAKAIRPVGAIHLTIGVMSLLTPERLDAACNYLKSLDIHSMLNAASISISSPPRPTPKPANPDSATSPSPPSTITEPPHPLTTTLTGLHTLRAPTNSSSLYASATTSPSSSSSPTLHPFATALRAAFTSAGFLIPEPRPLTLHATLINTIYARPRGASGKNRWAKGSARFDATDLIEAYKDVTWMRDVRIEKVAICEMGARDVWSEGEGRVVDQVYREVASVGLP